MTIRRERAGEIFALGHTLFYASLPLYIVLSKDAFPPLFFTGMSFVLAGAFLLPVALIIEKERFWPTKKVLVPMAVGAGIIVLIYYPLLTLAGQHTSSGNIAILAQTEVFFNFIFYGLLGLEVVTAKRVFGSALIVVGAVLILLQKFSGSLGNWDLLIVFLGALCPWANYLQKIALTVVGPLSLSVWRNLVGGVALLLLALAVEPVSFSMLQSEHFGLIVLNSVLAFGLAKWLLFAAFSRVGVAKTIAINAAMPAVTVLLAVIFLSEIPTPIQLLGLVAVTAGVLFVIDFRQTPRFVGYTESGDRIGRKIGFPTINLRTKTRLPHGIYAVIAEWDGKKFEGVMHCGPRPTLGKQERRVEIHLLDFEDHAIKAATRVKVEVIGKIREVEKFSSQEKLTEAIAGDILKARALFAKQSLPA